VPVRAGRAGRRVACGAPAVGVPGARAGRSAAPGRSASAAPESLGVRSAEGRSASAQPATALRASRWSRWAMRERIRRLGVLFRARLAAERASFATPCGAIARTAPNISRFPGGNQRSSRTSPDRPRFPGLNRGSSALQPPRDPARPFGPSSLIAKRDQKAARRAAPAGADAERPRLRGPRAAEGRADAERRPAAQAPNGARRRGRAAAVRTAALQAEAAEPYPPPVSSRRYTRYVFTLRPFIASIPRFMARLVSRIQPISPHLTGVTAAMSKCST
jgi:hypothetical protein